MAIEFKLPELGENIEAADVVNVMVKPGDTLQKDQPVLELETEKAVLELPCPHAGRVAAVNVKVGDHIAVGATVLMIEPAEQGVRPAPAADATKPAEQESQPAADKPRHGPATDQLEDTQRVEQRHDAGGDDNVTPPSAAADNRGVPDRPSQPTPPVAASPAIRRRAREIGVDLDKVQGTGPAGRITDEDLHSYVRSLAAGPNVSAGVAAGTAEGPAMPDFSQWGPVERQAISNIRRKTAESMTTAWRMVPQVTQYDLCDITALEAQRRNYMQARSDKSPKITVTAILLKAVVAALKEFPRFNASFDSRGGEMVYKKYYHIGVAVDTEHGLLVPVIRDVDRKSIVHLAKELDEVAKRARDRKLSLEEMRGSCFTITNLGGIGGTAFSPIVYWPEVAILGVARARQEQVIIEGAPQIRLMMPLCLSYDHRVIDGADGARFCRRLATILSDPLALFMET
jgi:pyruvate dehydrogenase E2 component (dihydrolipoamide acetyltransferase)